MRIGVLAAGLLAGGTAASAEEVIRLAQLSIQQRVIIRVPTRESLVIAPTRWKEVSGPKCIEAAALAGAQVGRNGVDLLLRGGMRVRAKLASACPALNYYSGFYVRPGLDGRICQDRDSIRTRAGGACDIDRFRKLVPQKPRK